jgi:hypothetical protein
MSRMRSRAVGATTPKDDVNEVGDHALTPRLLRELIGAIERQQVRRGEGHPPTMPR